MSLINKMLQDLDARGSQGDGALQADVRPVTPSERRVPLPVLLVSALGAVSLAAGGYFALRYYDKRHSAQPALAAQVPATVTVPARPALTVPTPPDAAGAAAAAPVTAAPMTAAPTTAASTTHAPTTAAPASPAGSVPATAAPVPASAAASAPVAVAAAASVAAVLDRPEPAPRRARAAAAPLVRKAVPAADVQPTARPGDDGRARADNQYRRALASMAEGRVTDTIDMLEAALRVDPRHDGARQTVVGLLIENKRHDDAMRHLQETLALDPRQPSMAILLARMQIERGGDGIDTLMRTLPAGAGKPEYHAFLAAALARAQRHRDAAEQYSAALRGAPNNAVWSMGLGIALQGDGRDAEALAAYQRALAGELSPELQAFVERKVNALAR